jgi:hypothetical protein
VNASSAPGLNTSESFRKDQALTSAGSGSSNSTTDNHIKLTVGLSLGLPLIVLVTVLVILLRRGALQKRREAEQQANLAQLQQLQLQQLQQLQQEQYWNAHLRAMAEVDGTRSLQELGNPTGLQELSATGLQELSSDPESAITEAPVNGK